MTHGTNGSGVDLPSKPACFTFVPTATYRIQSLNHLFKFCRSLLIIHIRCVGAEKAVTYIFLQFQKVSDNTFLFKKHDKTHDFTHFVT